MRFTCTYVCTSIAFYSALGPGPDEASKLILIDSHLTNEVLNPLASLSICIRYTQGSSSEFVAFADCPQSFAQELKMSSKQ